MPYTSHLTQHTSRGALIFIDSILQDKNPCVTDATLIMTDVTADWSYVTQAGVGLVGAPGRRLGSA